MTHKNIFALLICTLMLILACGFGPIKEGAPVEPASGTILLIAENKDKQGSFILYAIGPDGLGLQPLIDIPSLDSIQPVLSPDHTQLAMVRSEEDGSVYIYVLDIASSLRGEETALRRISPPPDILEKCFPDEQHGCLPILPVQDTSPTWSPDGNEIAFASNRSDNSDTAIYVINIDGSNLRRLSNEPGWCRACYTADLQEPCPRTFCDGESAPAWSPDGQKIAFIAHRTRDHVISPDPKYNEEHTTWEIHTFFMDGNGEEILAAQPDILSGTLLWMPDGRNLLVPVRTKTSEFGFDLLATGPDHMSLDLWVRGAEFLPNEGPRPAWSPDGSRLIYARYEEPKTCLYTIKPDGSDEQKLLSCKLFDDNNFSDPVWSPDGKHIVFLHWTGQSASDRPILSIANTDGSGWKEIVDQNLIDANIKWLGWAK